MGKNPYGFAGIPRLHFFALFNILRAIKYTGPMILLFWFSQPGYRDSKPHPGNPTSQPTQQIVLPASVPDPIEPFNRVMWDFNVGLMKDVIRPTSRVYRFVVRKPVRTSIGYFGTDLTYPARLINNLFQGKWTGARDETYRFLCNSTIGIGGLFDPADKLKIPKSEADFGQTLGQWGWRPQFYIMLPFFGQSNDRDTVGLAADPAANPLLDISPTKFTIERSADIPRPVQLFHLRRHLQQSLGHGWRVCALQRGRNGPLRGDSIRVDVCPGQ